MGATQVKRKKKPDQEVAEEPQVYIPISALDAAGVEPYEFEPSASKESSSGWEEASQEVTRAHRFGYSSSKKSAKRTPTAVPKKISWKREGKAVSTSKLTDIWNKVAPGSAYVDNSTAELILAEMIRGGLVSMSDKKVKLVGLITQ